MDILVFVRGSARPLDPRGAKVGGGIWASWVGGAGEVGGEGFRASVARRGSRGGLRASGLRGGRRGGASRAFGRLRPNLTAELDPLFGIVG